MNDAPKITRISAIDAAKLLGVSKATLYEWAKLKIIPAKKVLRNWFFIREELEAWMQSKPEN